MEIIFLIISFTIACLMVYSAGRMVYDTKDQVIESIKRSKSLKLNVMVPWYRHSCKTLMMLIASYLLGLIIGITVVGVVFMTLCACNNTFWHLPYLFTY